MRTLQRLLRHAFVPGPHNNHHSAAISHTALTAYLLGRNVGDGALQLFVRLQQAVEELELLNRFLGFVLIVPERRLTHRISEIPALFEFAGDVKESPAAVSIGS